MLLIVQPGISINSDVRKGKAGEKNKFSVINLPSNTLPF